MGKDRVVKKLLLEVYKKLSIRRGIPQKKLGRLQNEAQLLESQLKPLVVDKVAGQTLSYLEKEEPSIELDQYLGK